MNADTPRDKPIRLSGLLAALSLATDLGMGNPPEEAMRACLLAVGLARHMRVAEPDVRDIYYTTLLKYVGCTAYAHEEAAMFGGDDIGVRAAGARIDSADPRQLFSLLLSGVPKDEPVFGRVGALAGALYRGSRAGDELERSHCEVATSMSRRLGMPAGVEQGLYQVFERWDGKGAPQKLQGDEVALSARFALLATRAIIFHRIGGPEAALVLVREWSGKTLDPSICAAFARYGPALLEEIDAGDPTHMVVDAEPQLYLTISEINIDAVARAFGDMADLKLTFTRGHAPAVAELVCAAARLLRMPESDITNIYRAALLQDLGRVSVPNGIWEKCGPLTSADWERVRLHAYHSERILSCSPVLAPIASLAGMHHERMDGSGYHRQIAAAALPMSVRILGTADAYQAMTSDRPHRPALSLDAAESELTREVELGRMDAEAVHAVLTVAGHSAPRPPRSWPSGLSDREVEVLRLIARGASTRDVARDLYISPKTAGHHIQHIYNKIGVSTRAAAAMFAMEHDLLLR